MDYWNIVYLVHVCEYKNICVTSTDSVSVQCKQVAE